MHVSPVGLEAHRVAPPRRRHGRTDLRGRLVVVIGLLLISAMVFCALVVRQRDNRLRAQALGDAREIRTWLAEYVSQRGFLPSSLPTDRRFFRDSKPSIPYPSIENVAKLRLQEGPFVLIAGPQQGLITPGADGVAAVIYDHGDVHCRWLSISAIAAERRKRTALLTEAQ